MSREDFISWVKNHKTELIISGVAVAGTVLVIRNWDSIKGMIKSTGSMMPGITDAEPMLGKVASPIRSDDILNGLTGNKLTATALGEKVFCSAQEINKRIVAAGLATKLPSGKYMMTETGQMLGAETWKTTASGHAFSNIEWDEKNLEVIFSPEELLDIAEKQIKVSQILAA